MSLAECGIVQRDNKENTDTSSITLKTVSCPLTVLVSNPQKYVRTSFWLQINTKPQHRNHEDNEQWNRKLTGRASGVGDSIIFL